jgi:anti-sigma factor RsiW
MSHPPFESSSSDLKCQDVVELVTEYLSHALPAEQAARFEQHLFTCPPCAQHVRQVKAVIALSGALRDDVTEGSEAKLLEAFRRWKEP